MSKQKFGSITNNKNRVKEEQDLEKNEVVDETVEETTEEPVQANDEPTENDDLKKIQDDYEKLNQQYIRLAADFDNFRKRQEQERENLINFGKESVLKSMLEVLDNFERGEKSLENVEDCIKVKESFTLIHKQVCESLTKLGLEEIKAIGEDFDPNFHEAVMQTQTSEHKENTVIAELQKGYKVGDKVLRATLVNVATAE